MPKSQKQIFSEDVSDPYLLIFAEKVMAETFRQLGKSTEAVYFSCRYAERKSAFEGYLNTIGKPEVMHNTDGDTSIQDICVTSHEVSHKILDEKPEIRQEQEEATHNYINYFFESHPLLEEFIDQDPAFQITLKKRFGDWEFDFDEKKIDHRDCMR